MTSLVGGSTRVSSERTTCPKKTPLPNIVMLYTSNTMLFEADGGVDSGGIGTLIVSFHSGEFNPFPHLAVCVFPTSSGFLISEPSNPEKPVDFFFFPPVHKIAEN